MAVEMGENVPISRKGVKNNQNNSQGQTQAIVMSTREIVTRFQVDTLLQIMGMSMSAVGHLMPPQPVEGPAPSTPIFTEAHIACENTLVSACERLDALLKDETRWSTEVQEEAEKHFRESAALNAEMLRHQRDASKELTTPHFRFKPSILRMQDGSWCAFLGDLDHIEQSVVGVGATVQDCLDAFDDAFLGVTNEKVLAWLKSREQNAENGVPDAPFPTTNETNKMDGAGTGNPEIAGGVGDSNQADSGQAAPQPGLDSPKDGEGETGVDPETGRKCPKFHRRYGSPGDAETGGASPT